MLIFEQGYRWNRWTDFYEEHLKTRVSAGSAYLWESKQQFHNFRGQNPRKLPKIGIMHSQIRQVVKQPYIGHRWNYRLKFDRQIENGKKYP